jgi:hypothetical protein
MPTPAPTTVPTTTHAEIEALLQKLSGGVNSGSHAWVAEVEVAVLTAFIRNISADNSRLAEDLAEAHLVIASLAADADYEFNARRIKEGQAREVFPRETFDSSQPGIDDDERTAATIAEMLAEDERVRHLHIRDIDAPLTTS